MSKISYNLPEILERLAKPFPADQIRSYPMQVSKSAPWKGKVAFYADGRAVQQRLDETCVWQNVVKEDPRSSTSILSGIRILIQMPNGEYEWMTRIDGADNSDIEGTKGGLTSAFRRAGYLWGVGRYLYDTPDMWLPMKPPSNSKKGPQFFVNEPKIPAKFLPDASRARSISQNIQPIPGHSAEDEESQPDEPAKLTLEQTREMQVAATNKTRTKVNAIYKKIQAGTISFEDGITEINNLPDKK